MSNPVTENPNASVATSVGAATIIAVWVAQELGMAIPEHVSQAITVLGITIVLWFGSRRPSAPPARPEATK
jgi:hypothetical protein